MRAFYGLLDSPISDPRINIEEMLGNVLGSEVPEIVGPGPGPGPVESGPYSKLGFAGAWDAAFPADEDLVGITCGDVFWICAIKMPFFLLGVSETLFL